MQEAHAKEELDTSPALKTEGASPRPPRRPWWQKSAILAAVITSSATLIAAVIATRAQGVKGEAPSSEHVERSSEMVKSRQVEPPHVELERLGRSSTETMRVDAGPDAEPKTSRPEAEPREEATVEAKLDKSAEPTIEPEEQIEPPKPPEPQPKATPQPRPVDADQEPNDLIAAASGISLSGSLSGRVGWGDDRVDYFALRAPADGKLTFTVQATCESVKGQREGLGRPRVLRPDGSERYHTHASRVPCGKSVTSDAVTVGANETVLIELKSNTTSGTSYLLSWSFKRV